MPRSVVVAALFALMVCSHQPAGAQSGSGSFDAGLELDVLPFLTGGYFGAAWVGKNHVRLRGLTAHVNMPGFIVADGFEKNEIESAAVVLDVFRDQDFTGWWLSSGPVRWNASIRDKGNPTSVDYTLWLLHGGIGYVHFLNRHVYVSPWAGISLRIGGDEEVETGGGRYEPPLLNPEMSFKLGWRI